MAKATEKKTKGKVGRPTVFTFEKVGKFEEGLRLGLTIDESCFRADIARGTFFDWLSRNPDYKERMELLRRAVNIGAKEVIALKIKEKDPFTSRWFLEKTDPAFSQKIQSVNLNVNASSELTDEQKRAIAERYASRTEEVQAGA